MAEIPSTSLSAVDAAVEPPSWSHGTLVAPLSATAITSHQRTASPAHPHPSLETVSPVNQNGCFEFDRVLRCGYVQKRTKTKAWKNVYLVMRPNTIYVYKSDKEDKLRGKIYLSELTAVTLLKDPKQKRQNVFGLFSPSKNFYFQAATEKDSLGWVDVIRRDARIEEEEEEIFLASPVVRRESYGAASCLAQTTKPIGATTERERVVSSSPEPPEPSIDATHGTARPACSRWISAMVESSSGQLGSDMLSQSDMSDLDPPSRSIGASAESLRVNPPAGPGPRRPTLATRSGGGSSAMHLEQDPDRVIWQGALWLLRAKGGLRQWKRSWAVLRPRNLILYRDSSEYSPHLVVALSSILNVVDLDPISKTKRHCLQVITEEKRFRFCALDEESLLQCLGAFKSLLAKRRELEARAAATIAGTAPAASADVLVNVPVVALPGSTATAHVTTSAAD